MIVCMEWPKLKIINNLRPFFFKKKNVNSRLFFYLGHYFFFQLDPIILCLLRFRNNDVFWSTMLCWLRFKNDGLFRFIFDVVNLISKKNLVIVLVPNLTENNLILLFAYNWKWEEWNCLIEQIFRKTIFVSLPFPQIHSLGFDKKSFSVPWAWRLIDNPQLYFSCIIVHGEKESSDYGMVGRMRKLINIHFLVIKLVILDANGSIRWRLFYLDHVCFSEFTFREITFQTFLCLFVIKKVGQRKTFSSQKKIWFGFQENVFPFIRWRLFYLDSFFSFLLPKKYIN
jgi:hypothetical protein